MTARSRASRSVLSLLVMLLAALVGQPAAAQPNLVTTVRVNPARVLTLNGTFVGLGAQDDSNLLWSAPNRAAGAHVPGDDTLYVAPRLRALHLPFVRKFIDVSWYAPTPYGYTWDSAAMQALYANLALHKEAGTRVLLTVWVLPPWLSAQPALDRDTALRAATSFPSAGTQPDYEARWADVVVDLLRHLRGLDGSGLDFDTIAAVGGPNELAHIDAGRLVRPYSLLRERLRAAGLAEQVALYGPDAFVEEVLIARDQPGLDPLLGFYDFHYYAAAPFEASFSAAVDRLANAIGPSGKQLWLTEFGELQAKNDDWRALPLFAITGMNHGLAALAVWNVQDQIYNTANMPAWGLWGVYDSGYQIKPAFYAWQIIAAHLPPAASVYGNSCDREQCAGLRIAVLGDSTGQRAVIAYNLDTRPHSLRLELGAAAPVSAFSRYLLDPAALPNPISTGTQLPRVGVLGITDGVLRDTLPPGALVVYSTYNPTLAPPVRQLH